VTTADPPQELASRGRKRDPDIDHRVLTAARVLVGENGVRGASFSAIAELARVGKPSVYLRWPNYTSVLVAVITDMETAVEPVTAGTLSGRLLQALEQDEVFLTDPERVGFIGAVLHAADAVPECATELQARILGPRRDRLVSILRGTGWPFSRERSRRIEAAADALQAPLLHAIVCGSAAPSYGGRANVVAIVVEGVGSRSLRDNGAGSPTT
jgi:AcrR family transcriptional regulator